MRVELTPEEGMEYIHEARNRIASLTTERDAARAALKVAHHALNFVHGLWASDKPVVVVVAGTAELFRIDTLKAIEAIEEVLKDD